MIAQDFVRAGMLAGGIIAIESAECRDFALSCRKIAMATVQELFEPAKRC